MNATEGSMWSSEFKIHYTDGPNHRPTSRIVEYVIFTKRRLRLNGPRDLQAAFPVPPPRRNRRNRNQQAAVQTPTVLSVKEQQVSLPAETLAEMDGYTVQLQDEMTGPGNQRTPDEQANPAYRILPLSVTSAKSRSTALQDALEESLEERELDDSLDSEAEEQGGRQRSPAENAAALWHRRDRETMRELRRTGIISEHQKGESLPFCHSSRILVIVGCSDHELRQNRAHAPRRAAWDQPLVECQSI